MSPSAIERWKRMRQLGKARYILQTGVLRWGMTMFIVMTFVINIRPESLKGVAVALTIWAFGGLLFGWLTWEVGERRYHRAVPGGSGA